MKENQKPLPGHWDEHLQVPSVTSLRANLEKLGDWFCKQTSLFPPAARRVWEAGNVTLTLFVCGQRAPTPENIPTSASFKFLLLFLLLLTAGIVCRYQLKINCHDQPQTLSHTHTIKLTRPPVSSPPHTNRRNYNRARLKCQCERLCRARLSEGFHPLRVEETWSRVLRASAEQVGCLLKFVFFKELPHEPPAVSNHSFE